MTQPTATASSEPASRARGSTRTAPADLLVQRAHFVNAVHIIGSGIGPKNSLDAEKDKADFEFHPAGLVITLGGAKALVPYSNLRNVELL